jgi:hypothetical protein
MSTPRCHTLYRSAVRVDRAFDQAIKKAFGSRATRWTVSKAQVASSPKVRAAYKRKVALDKATSRACHVMRRRPGGLLFGDAAPPAPPSSPAAPTAPVATKTGTGRTRRRRR